MSFRLLTNALRQSQTRKRAPFSYLLSHSFSQQLERPSFGIAFDIDGVILLGNSPVGGSPEALKRLYAADGRLKIPYVFLTNGGGYPEAKRASELSQLLGINVSSSQVLQGHSPFRQLVNRYENKLIVAVGKGEPAVVMSEYGFKNVLPIDEYASCFENIDPLAPYKQWTTKLAANQNPKSDAKAPRIDVFSERVQAAFIVSDPVDWSRDIQVLCDILKTGGLPGRNVGMQPHLYFANDDLEYQNPSSIGEITSVYVRNLPADVTEDEIDQEFKNFGRIKPDGIFVRVRKEFGVCYAFVEFEDITGVQNALQASPIQVAGRQVYIEERRPNTGVGATRGGRGRGRGRGYPTDAPRGRFGGRSFGRGNYQDTSDYTRPRGDGYQRVSR